jgi:hypothetical protein
MFLAQYDDVIKRVSAYAADYPLTIWVLPRTLRGNLHRFDTHVLDAGLAGGAIDRVPVSQQVTRCRIPRECLNDLLRRSLSGGVLGDIDMHDTSTLVSQHEKDEQYPERGSGHGEKITGHYVLHVIVHEGFPRR